MDANDHFYDKELNLIFFSQTYNFWTKIPQTSFSDVAGWLIVSQDGDYLHPGQYSQTICQIADNDDTVDTGGNINMARPSTNIVVNSWKAGPVEVLTVKNLFIIKFTCSIFVI